MRVLVSGGAGFIGSHLARALLSRGDEVTIVDDLSMWRRATVPDGAEFLELDLASRQSVALRGDRQFVSVCHLAGQSSGEKSFENPARDFDSNARSTALLASWASERGV